MLALMPTAQTNRARLPVSRRGRNEQHPRKAAPSGGAKRGAASTRRSGAGGDVMGYVAEGVAGVGAERADGRDAHDDDQGQHDRVLDRRRAVLTLEELDQSRSKARKHGNLHVGPGSRGG